MKLNIPANCYIRWQAALAVLEDLQEDKQAPFTMTHWAGKETIWEKTNGCGTAACFAGYMSIAPYCRALGYPKDDNGWQANYWLLDGHYGTGEIYRYLFHYTINKGSRAKTLTYLKKTLKQIFKDSTGKRLVAPLTFWI